MLGKTVFAAAMALGLGGGVAAIQPAEAAVMATGASPAVTGTLDTAAPAAMQVYYYGGGGYGYGYRPHYYRPYYRCRWVVRRVYRPSGWVVVRRRICG